MLEKNVFHTKQGLLFPMECKGTYYSHMLNKEGDQKCDHPCTLGLSFCGQRWTFDIGLAMQIKSRM